MPNPLKYIESSGLYLVTSRTEEGLPFSNFKDFSDIFHSILARAQYLYPVEIAAYVLMPNHFHMLLSPIDPLIFPKFIGYLKQELAHAVNRSAKRRQKTIWSSGYDSPILLGFEEAIHYFVYIFTQAQSAHMVNKIEEYSGPNSWRMLTSHTKKVTYPRWYRNKKDQQDRDKPTSFHYLEVTPFNWLKKLAPDITPEAAKKLIIQAVREREDQLSTERMTNNIKLRGINSSTTYTPKKFSKRMWCICWDINYRKIFIAWIKSIVNECRDTYKSWKSGDISKKWPIYFFPPALPKLVNATPSSLSLE